MKYYVQQKAPAGNFYDVLGTDNFKTAQKHQTYLTKANPEENYRVISRRDTEENTHLATFNDELKALQVRLELLKDNGIIDEEAFQMGLLGLSYLQQAGH